MKKEMLEKNLVDVEGRICEACGRVGRLRESVSLIAVSKTKPVEMIQDFYDLGVRDFGENKVQELLDKYDKLPSDIQWHLIGHLQRNKVKYIIDKVYMIHSVDSLRLAEEISREALKHQCTARILIEVNISGEESKFGVPASEAAALVEEIAKLPCISVRGLMTVPPFVEVPEKNRDFFYKLRELAVDIGEKNIDNVTMGVLSMGMTNDYMVAIEEGSNYVRIGTALFGQRDYAAKV